MNLKIYIFQVFNILMDQLYELISNTHKLNEKISLFEKTIDTILFDSLSKNIYSDLLTGKPVEFASNDEFLTSFPSNRYVLYGRIQKPIKFLDPIQFKLRTQQETKNKIISKEMIGTISSDLYRDINSFVSNHIYTHEAWKEIVLLDSKIVQLTNTIKHNFSSEGKLNEAKLATKLYQYYYTHLDQFININKKTHLEKNFYDFIRDKYQVLQPGNFNLDYLQFYWKHFMGLEQNMVYSYPCNFESDKTIVKINLNPARYTGTYYPMYNVEIYDKQTGEKIKTIEFDEFDSDRQLEKYYSQLFDFIQESINLIKIQ